MSKTIENITEASSAASQLPQKRDAQLAGGRQITVYRLSWLKFEALWDELSALLAAVLGAGEDVAPEAVCAQLASAPGFVLKLCCLSTNLPEAELTRWSFDEVLDLAGESIALNFAESAGLRDFFSALSRLSSAEA